MKETKNNYLDEGLDYYLKFGALISYLKVR